mgnify:CR=1 FL=1
MQELLAQGRLTQEEIAHHPQRSLLTQALVGDSGIDPVLIVFPAKVGDAFLICSDGLSSVLSGQLMNEIITKNRTDGQSLVDELIKATKAQGAPDNITVIWAEVVAVETLVAAKRPYLIDANSQNSPFLLATTSSGNFAMELSRSIRDAALSK